MINFNIDYSKSSISDNYFPFTPINKSVSITPMSNLFCARVRERFKRDMSGIILPFQCFKNAVLSAEWFQQHGFDDVEVVDGYYSENRKALEKFARVHNITLSNAAPCINDEHRFLRRGDRYFDTTLEFLFGFEFARCYEYLACRAFEPSVIAAYSVMAARANNLDTEFEWASSMEGKSYRYLESGEDIPMYWGRISEDFNFVK